MIVSDYHFDLPVTLPQYTLKRSPEVRFLWVIDRYSDRNRQGLHVFLIFGA